MAQSQLRDMKHGTAQAKVAGDDEMLRTGFHNGTPLEAGKIADSQPVDLFAPAHRVAHAPRAPESSAEPNNNDDEDRRQPQSAAAADPPPPPTGQQGRQGMADQPTAGGRRLGRQA